MSDNPAEKFVFKKFPTDPGSDKTGEGDAVQIQGGQVSSGTMRGTVANIVPGSIPSSTPRNEQYGKLNPEGNSEKDSEGRVQGLAGGSGGVKTPEEKRLVVHEEKQLAAHGEKQPVAREEKRPVVREEKQSFAHTVAAHAKFAATTPAAAAGAVEMKFDETARARMMYEGSDRETPGQEREGAARNSRKGIAQDMAQDITQDMMRDTMRDVTRDAGQSRGPAGQKAYPRRPLTEKTKMQRPRLIGVCNQKGGVGKTTTAINLATALCAVGKKVLLIDMDPQGNASTGLGVRRSAIRTSVYDVLFEGADVIEASVTTRVPGLSVVPSSIHLSGAEIELVTAESREYRLKKALHRALPFEYVIVDCPPSLNLLTLNVLVAMDSILVPLQCEFYALEGLSHLVKTIERVQKSFNPDLDIHGVVLTMYDQRNRLSGQVEDDVRQHFGDKVYKTVIPRNVRLSEAPSFGLPAIVYDMKCSGSQAYIKLAREVIARERSIAAANETGGSESGGGGSARVA